MENTYLEFGSVEERDEFEATFEAMKQSLEDMKNSQTILVGVLTGAMTPEKAIADYGVTVAGPVLATIEGLKGQVVALLPKE